MSQIKKESFKMGLDSYQIYINDTDVNSKYFSVKDVPPAIIAGKNYFLIAGTSLLVPGSPVSIEALDSSGNTIYCEVANILIDGIYRLATIIAYPDTPNGMTTITVLGEAINVPLQWKGKYNVKWKIVLPVNTMAGDTNHPIFRYTPKLYFSEIYDENRNLDYINEPVVVSRAVDASGVAGTANGNISRDAPYYLTWASGAFSADMVGGIMSINSPNSSIYQEKYITQIVQVINCSTVKVSPSYLYSKNYTNKTIDANSLAFRPIDFSPSAFTLRYTTRYQNTGSINKRISYLNVHAVDLDTYVGTLKYMNLYKQPGNVFIGKYPLQPHEMIVSGGYFNNLADFSSSWSVVGQNQWSVNVVQDIYSSSYHEPTPQQYDSASSIYGIKQNSSGVPMSGYMNDSGHIRPSPGSLTLLWTAISPYKFFSGNDVDYTSSISKLKTYIFATSSTTQSMSIAVEDSLGVYINGQRQFGRSGPAFATSMTLSFAQGFNQVEMYLQNKSNTGSMYIDMMGFSLSTGSFVGGMNGMNIPAATNFNSCKLIDSIHFYSPITGSLVQ